MACSRSGRSNRSSRCLPATRCTSARIRIYGPAVLAKRLQGHVARKERALRGRFENPEADNGRWEQLKYRGVPLVDAFVIRKRDDKIVGQSEPFRVMIE